MEFSDGVSAAAGNLDFDDQVSTIMSRSVVVANDSHHFSEVVDLFSHHSIHHLPIVDADGKLVGMLSSNDILKIFTEPKYKTLTIDTAEIDKVIKLSDIMTANPVTIAPGDTIKSACVIFAEKKFTVLPVVEDSAIVGILSVKDVIHTIAYFS